MSKTTNGNGTAPDPNRLLQIKQSDAQLLMNCLSEMPCGKVYALVTMLLHLQPVKTVDQMVTSALNHGVETALSDA
jgi:hypothetical protein